MFTPVRRVPSGVFALGQLTRSLAIDNGFSIPQHLVLVCTLVRGVPSIPSVRKVGHYASYREVIVTFKTR